LSARSGSLAYNRKHGAYSILSVRQGTCIDMSERVLEGTHATAFLVRIVVPKLWVCTLRMGYRICEERWVELVMLDRLTGPRCAVGRMLREGRWELRARCKCGIGIVMSGITAYVVEQWR